MHKRVSVDGLSVDSMAGKVFRSSRQFSALEVMENCAEPLVNTREGYVSVYCVSQGQISQPPVKL
jgi:hypothetical protein